MTRVDEVLFLDTTSCSRPRMNPTDFQVCQDITLITLSEGQLLFGE